MIDNYMQMLQMFYIFQRKNNVKNSCGLPIDTNPQPDYREKLEVELAELRDFEMWQAGKVVRSLRPKI